MFSWWKDKNQECSAPLLLEDFARIIRDNPSKSASECLDVYQASYDSRLEHDKRVIDATLSKVKGLIPLDFRVTGIDLESNQIFTVELSANTREGYEVTVLVPQVALPVVE